MRDGASVDALEGTSLPQCQARCRNWAVAGYFGLHRLTLLNHPAAGSIIFRRRDRTILCTRFSPPVMLGCGSAGTFQTVGALLRYGTLYTSGKGYLPLQHGARLPRNAAVPSCASAARAFIDITSLA